MKPFSERQRYCVMGNPVGHSKSPWIHTRFAELTGQPTQYGAVLAPMDGFAAAVEAWRAAGGCGCNVTVPFKHDAARLATRPTPRVLLARAANTLRFDERGEIAADNTDGIGLVADLVRNAGVGLAALDILVLGAGGAAAGLLGPLLETRPSRVVVANRTRGRADDLVARHAALAGECAVALESAALHAVPGAFDLVINATASSMAGAGVPVAAAVLRPGALAVDLMYGPAAEGFMAWARSHGATARDGLGMLVEQAAEAFMFWRGVRPPAARVLAELRLALERAEA